MIYHLTGNVMEDDVEEFLAAGVDIVISKPIKILTLDLLIEHINLYGSLSVPDKYLAQSYGALNWVKRSHILKTKTLLADLA
jgi:CheY-like chemotaxis protein